MEFPCFYYLDASVLVQLVVQEQGTDAIKRYMKDKPLLPFRAIVPCFIEVLSVLKRKYQRKEMDKATYFAACDDLGGYTCADGRVKLENVDISDSAVFWQVHKIAKRAKRAKSSHLNIDVIDACQIFAMKKTLEKLSHSRTMKPILITADRELREASRREGLIAWLLTDTLEVPPIEDLTRI